MAGTVTSATSSLASELLLNKIMNGQVQTSTGQTITAAGRALSANLSGDAYKARVAETNMAYGEGLVSAAQNELSSLKDQLLLAKQNIIDVQNRNSATKSDWEKVAADAKTMVMAAYNQATAAQYNGKTLAIGKSVSLNTGNGSINVLTGINVKTADIKGATVIKGTTKGDLAASLKTLDKAINALIHQEATAAGQIKAVQNKALLLADQGANLDSAAASQGVASMSGANNLLSAMLGGGTNV